MSKHVDAGDKYICAYCGKEYTAETSYDEAKEEHDQNFPDENIEDAVVVCDDCYQIMISEVPTPGRRKRKNHEKTNS